MSRIYLLDQTLREGGYINGFQFGTKTIAEILSGLANANIDMIECGFIKSERPNSNSSVFSEVKQIESLIRTSKNQPHYIAMIEVKEEIPKEAFFRTSNSVDAIRVSFHEHEIRKAIDYTESLTSEGFNVFFQPIGFTTFSKQGILGLIEQVNRINPYAFYIVDTLGQMLGGDINKALKMIDDRLNPQIKLGFHSHNNCQMSFSNAITILDFNLSRDVIIDASIMGLGRGAGTIHTEMIAHYLNKYENSKYEITSLLSILDKYIMPISNNTYGKEAIAYYFSAINSCHPNYATYLLNKKELSSIDIYSIIHIINESKKALYDEEYIKTVLTTYLKIGDAL